MKSNASQSSAFRSINRREFFGLAWLASISAVAIRFLDVFLKTLIPEKSKGQSGLFEIGSISELPTAEMPPVNYPEGKFWLVRTEQGVQALFKVCPHLDCLFNWDDQNGSFLCPCHGSEFGKDGAYLGGPSSRSLDSFVVRMVASDGQFVAETDPERGGPLPIPEASPTSDDEAEAETEAESEPSIPDYFLIVDTNRKIIGRPLE